MRPAKSNQHPRPSCAKISQLSVQPFEMHLWQHSRAVLSYGRVVSGGDCRLPGNALAYHLHYIFNGPQKNQTARTKCKCVKLVPSRIILHKGQTLSEHSNPSYKIHIQLVEKYPRLGSYVLVTANSKGILVYCFLLFVSCFSCLMLLSPPPPNFYYYVKILLW